MGGVAHTHTESKCVCVFFISAAADIRDVQAISPQSYSGRCLVGVGGGRGRPIFIQPECESTSSYTHHKSAVCLVRSGHRSFVNL